MPSVKHVSTCFRMHPWHKFVYGGRVTVTRRITRTIVRVPVRRTRPLTQYELQRLIAEAQRKARSRG